MKKLEIDVLSGAGDKVAEVQRWLDAHGRCWADVLAVGNDINDVQMLAKSVRSTCPADAWPEVTEIVDLVLDTDGGRGAIAELGRRVRKLGSEEPVAHALSCFEAKVESHLITLS
jgi:N-acylneuraminate cytidylyltransferase